MTTPRARTPLEHVTGVVAVHMMQQMDYQWQLLQVVSKEKYTVVVFEFLATCQQFSITIEPIN